MGEAVVTDLQPSGKSWSVTPLQRNVFRITVPYKQNKDWEWWFLLTSDQHWDNPYSNQKLQKKHLDEARERGAAVMSAGDYFCLMQGKFDKRANKSDIRPEHMPKPGSGETYFGLVQSTAVDFLLPYSDLYTVIATGNHEAAVDSRREGSVIGEFCSAMYQASGGKNTIYNGGFSGWIIFSFPVANQTGDSSCRITLHYDHGYGGGGPVTADMIQHQRRSVYLPDADIILSGHTHDQWVREIARVRLNRDGTIRHDIQTHIKTPSYKDERKDGFGGWANTKGMPPKPIGAWWLRFFWSREHRRVLYETIQAR